jgi:hypothetical protein
MAISGSKESSEYEESADAAAEGEQDRQDDDDGLVRTVENFLVVADAQHVRTYKGIH